MTRWSVPALAAAFIFGAVVGGAFTQPQPLRAAGNTAVYGIYEANVTDQEGYKDKFLSLVVPKLEKNGIKYLARGGKNQTLIGTEAPNRVVVTEAPSMDAEMAFWNEAKDDFKIGQKYSTGMRFVIVEGVGLAK
jgi:uncharacterized protein (DUF1330 family)